MEAVEKVVLNSQEGVHGRISRGDLLPISRAGLRHVYLEEASLLILLRTSTHERSSSE